MENLVELRNQTIKIYKANETFITVLLKFIMGLFVFSKINNLDLIHAKLNFLSNIYITPLFAACFSFLPTKPGFLLIILSAALYLSSFYPFAVLVFLSLLCIYIFYIRMAPKEAILILLMIFGLYFNIPCAVVIAAAIYMSATAIIPIVIGVFLYYISLKFASLLVVPADNLSIMELAQNFLALYKSIVTTLTTDFDWIAISFIYILVFYLVYIISRLSIPYAKGFSVVSGVFLNLFGFIIISIAADVQMSILDIMIFPILSGIIPGIFLFFDIMLDYEKIERVQFEDENNIYYVKIVPKLNMAKEGLYSDQNNFSVKNSDIPPETKRTSSRVDEINMRQRGSELPEKKDLVLPEKKPLYARDAAKERDSYERSTSLPAPAAIVTPAASASNPRIDYTSNRDRSTRPRASQSSQRKGRQNNKYR